MAAFGFKPEDMAAAPVEVWPDVWQSFKVFEAMSTQWRVGVGGAIGLDYNVLPEIWRRTKTPISSRDDIFHDLRIMEQDAMKEMQSK